MSEEWQYQVRINLNEERAETARRDATTRAYHPRRYSREAQRHP